MQTLKNLEDLGAVFGVDADALVLDPETHPPGARRRRRGARRRARGVTVRGEVFRPKAHPGEGAGHDEFDGVVEQVDETLAERGLVAEHRRQRTVDPDVRPIRPQFRTLRDERPREGIDVDRGQLDPLAGDAIEMKHVLDQILHARGGLRNAMEELGAGRRFHAGRFQGELDKALDGPHRRPEIVGETVGKSFELRHGGAQLRGTSRDRGLEVVGLGAQVDLGFLQSLLGALAFGTLHLEVDVGDLGGLPKLVLPESAYEERLVHRRDVAERLIGAAQLDDDADRLSLLIEGRPHGVHPIGAGVSGRLGRGSGLEPPGLVNAVEVRDADLAVGDDIGKGAAQQVLPLVSHQPAKRLVHAGHAVLGPVDLDHRERSAFDKRGGATARTGIRVHGEGGWNQVIAFGSGAASWRSPERRGRPVVSMA